MGKASPLPHISYDTAQEVYLKHEDKDVGRVKITEKTQNIFYI